MPHASGSDDRIDTSRRRMLAGLAVLATGGTAVATTIAGCAAPNGAVVPGPPEGSVEIVVPRAAPVRVPLASLGGGARVRVQYGDIPVEVRQTSDGVRATALLCTHTGCKVVWREDMAFYQCACHDAHFDIEGVPIAGLPTKRLVRIPVATTGDHVVVGGA